MVGVQRRGAVGPLPEAGWSEVSVRQQILLGMTREETGLPVSSCAVRISDKIKPSPANGFRGLMGKKGACGMLPAADGSTMSPGATTGEAERTGHCIPAGSICPGRCPMPHPLTNILMIFPVVGLYSPRP
jgi:hypothetical protein